ncbi:MAG: TerB family tellurite resistance protein [Burkholderiales bacterium]|jgi:uncharacterized tellurite resistance protein B-like protein
MIEQLLAQFRNFIDDIAPSPAILAQRETLELQSACCGLLMEIARLDSAGTEKKRKAVAHAMQELFELAQEDLLPLIANAGREENRLTSYFKPVALINRHFAAERKAQLIECLWRIAIADGKIDMYEEQLVRKLADLLYVPHSDFILAKHRVQSLGEAPAK